MKSPAKRYAAVAQLDRVFGYEPKGLGFESLQPYQFAVSISAYGELFYNRGFAS